MLKGLDPRLNADVLYVLRAMGHGDTLILSDTNFPAESIASETTYGALLRMENLTLGAATEA
ncbi:MAG: RbsD/FucU domain-containing protein, partial [Pseudomonadota bacterium]